LLEEDEDKGFELFEVRGVRRVFAWQLVVDRCQEVVRFEVSCELGWVAIVLRLLAIEAIESEQPTEAGRVVSYRIVSRCKEDKEKEARHLNEISLRPLIVYTSACRIPHKVAQYVVGFARGDIRNAHVLRAKGDEIPHWRVVVTLDVCSHELAPYM
jgi:hypothetical protein